MAMRHLENELRRSGDPHDLERAEIIASILKARGRDISLAVASAPICEEPTKQES